jgi:galactokinase
VPVELAAFAPGRVNLIGEHTDYNGGLALPFAIAQGVTVRATAGSAGERVPSGAMVSAWARDLDERDTFSAEHPGPSEGWRAFVRGIVAELARAGYGLPETSVEITGDVPRGGGLSSSAALEVALCLALSGVSRETLGECADDGGTPLRPIDIARLCSRVENEWAGAQTGLLDQLASLHGAVDHALLIDFRSLEVQPVPLELGDWRLVVLDSGEARANVSSGYNERRAECASACRLLAVDSLRELDEGSLDALPGPLDRRARHVLEENRRVLGAVAALRERELDALGSLLDASHASLRDLYEVSTPAVERAVARMHEAGAAGARLVGGGFGGSILGLFAPGRTPPDGAREVRPSAGAHRLEDRA